MSDRRGWRPRIAVAAFQRARRNRSRRGVFRRPAGNCYHATGARYQDPAAYRGKRGALAGARPADADGWGLGTELLFVLVFSVAHLLFVRAARAYRPWPALAERSLLLAISFTPFPTALHGLCPGLPASATMLSIAMFVSAGSFQLALVCNAAGQVFVPQEATDAETALRRSYLGPSLYLAALLPRNSGAVGHCHPAQLCRCASSFRYAFRHLRRRADSSELAPPGSPATALGGIRQEGAHLGGRAECIGNQQARSAKRLRCADAIMIGHVVAHEDGQSSGKGRD